jgi:hypothetical protein
VSGLWWEVIWRNTVTGQAGADVVEAPTREHAIWQVASGYKEEYIEVMEFVGAGPASPDDVRKYTR